MSFPQIHLICGTGTEAIELAPVALAMRAAGLLRPILVAGEPAALGLAAFDLAADLSVPGGSLTEMIAGFDELWAVRTPDAVFVSGLTVISLAAALAAVWRHVPVVHLGAGRRSDEFEQSSDFAAADRESNGRLITQLASVHLAPTPVAAMNLLDEGIAAADILIAGDTTYDAALVVARRHLSSAQIAHTNPYGDGRAADRAAQATAALLGLAGRPEPMPVPSTYAPATATFGA